MVDSNSSKKLKQREWRKANKLRNLEIARGRWTEKIEKFIEAVGYMPSYILHQIPCCLNKTEDNPQKNIIKAYRDNEPRRLECIADELWKLKNVEECQTTKTEGFVLLS